MRAVVVALAAVLAAAPALAETPEQRLAAKGIVLPEPVKPVATYLTAARSGNLLFLSGHGQCGTQASGKVGADMTVEQGRAFAHAKQGWETFTRAALEYAVQQSVAPLAAVLWGKPAQKYAPVFAAVQHRRPVLVLESAHPSPLSAYRGFFGSAPFGKINAFLQQHGEAAIDWLK